MKKVIYLFIIGLLLMNACRDESLDPRPVIEDNIGAITLLDIEDPTNLFFDLTDPNLANDQVTFTINVDGFEVTEIESVDIILSFVEADRVFDPFREEFVDSVYAPIQLGTVTTFPSTFTYTAADIAEAVGFGSADDFEVGDNFTITFPINTADGRRLTTALASDLCNQPAQPSFGGCAVTWAASCPSDLGGDYSYTITSATLFGQGNASNLDNSGTLTITDEGSGVYTWSSYTFGGYQYLYGCCEQQGSGSAIRMVDVCNTLSLTDDSFGCGWNFTDIQIDGSTMTLTVEGGCIDVYTIAITRTDGSAWPNLSI